MYAEGLHRRNRIAIRFLCVLLPLLTGTVFYLFFDAHTVFSAQMRRLFPAISQLYISDAWTDRPAFRLCRNYLCDFCWAFSLESSVLLLLGCRRHGLIRSVGITLLLSGTLETLQKTALIRGTFDPADILTETIAILVAGFILYYFGGKGSLKPTHDKKA